MVAHSQQTIPLKSLSHPIISCSTEASIIWPVSQMKVLPVICRIHLAMSLRKSLPLLSLASNIGLAVHLFPLNFSMVVIQSQWHCVCTMQLLHCRMWSCDSISALHRGCLFVLEFLCHCVHSSVGIHQCIYLATLTLCIIHVLFIDRPMPCQSMLWRVPSS